MYPSTVLRMYGHPINYNPFVPHGQSPPAPDVDLAQLKAAKSVNASHLSADGKTAYDQRNYGTWYCTWDEETKRFSSWWPIDGLPGDAVVMPV